MKAFLFIVETQKQGSHILYLYPHQSAWENQFLLNDNENGDPWLITKEKIKRFLSENEQFGMINNTNLFGFQSSFLSDFLAPTKSASSHEIFIDDLVFVTFSLTLKDCKQRQSHIVTAFNLVLVSSRVEPKLILFQKKALTYLAKTLEIQEQLQGCLSQQVNKIQEKNAEFERRLNQLAQVEVEKMKLNLQDIPKRLNDFIRQIQLNEINNIELYSIFTNFFISVENQEEIKVNHFQQRFPFADMLFSPCSIQIKPYQTLMIRRQRNQPGHKALRFEKFLQIINPYKSFEELSMLYNFTLSEMQMFVEHLRIHNKGIIMNKITPDSLFTLNPQFKFQLDKQVIKLSERFFQTYKIDFLSIIAAFNRPQTQAQISQDIAGCTQKCLITLVGQQVIVECDVYLYSMDPFATKDRLRKKLQSTQSLSQDTFDFTSSKEEEFDNMLFRRILKYQNTQMSIHEHAWYLHAEVGLIWRFIQKYDFIGYFFLNL